MIIENLRLEDRDKKVRLAATVKWEDCERPVEELYFETRAEFSDDISCNPNAFLVACVAPAMYFGEKRIFLDAEVCPELKNGLVTVMHWFRHWWYEPDRELVKIEAKSMKQIDPKNLKRAAVFYSGGIDSFTTIYLNRLTYPSEHPGFIKDGLHVFGLEHDDIETFEYLGNSLTKFADEIGITYIPVYTNIYLNHMEEDSKNNFDFFHNQYQSASISAVAHIFTKRLSYASTSSGTHLRVMRPTGCHPLIDHNYSSYDLRIQQRGVYLSRLEKVRLLSNWSIALPYIRVCNRYKSYWLNTLNCGRCEKCICTMLELLALKLLDRTDAFPRHDVNANDVRKAVVIENSFMEDCYIELLSPLAEQGRLDLVKAIRERIAIYHGKVPLRQRVGEIDRKFLGGNLKRLMRMVIAN